MPQISVIVPVYDVEPYIHRCVDSILAQTYTDFELILVDDGSPDNCGTICDEYAAKDSRIHVIHQENGGLSAARNAGLNRASGAYIYFVDSDDYIDLTLLETVVPYMESGSDLVAFGYTFFNDMGDECRALFKPNEWFLNKENRVFFFVKELLQYKLGWDAWSRVFRRDIIKKHHIRFEDNAKIFAEDMYFSLCYCAYVKRIVCIDNALYYYYQRDGSIMRQEKTVLNAGRMNELGKAVLKYYETEPVDPSLIRAFPVIFYFIMENVISRYKKNHALTINQFRNLLINDIDDFAFYSAQMHGLRKNRKLLRLIYSAYQTEERIDVAEFNVDGNVFLLKAKRKINSYLEKVRK